MTGRADPTRRVRVTRRIAAPPDVVWAMVADVTRMGEWSPETVAAEWTGGATGPRAGATFRGTNRHGRRTWRTVARVVACEPPSVFAFAIRAAGFAVAEWRYDLEPDAGGCTVTETWTDRRNPLVRRLSTLVSGVADRPAHNRAGMERTVERLAAAAEAGPAAP